MTILIYMAVWQRPEITEICFLGIKRLQKVPGFNVKPFAVISEESMIPLCEKYGVDWCMTENSPLGAKKNYGLSQAMKVDFDYLVEIGSDDLLKDEFLQTYKWEAPMYGLMDFTLVNTTNGSCKKIRTEIPKFGAGRAIKKSALGFKLWVDRKNFGLDNCSNFILAHNGVLATGVRCEEPIAVALKGEVNLWAFNKIPGVKHDLEQALEGLSKEELNAIGCLITKNKLADLTSA